MYLDARKKTRRGTLQCQSPVHAEHPLQLNRAQGSNIRAQRLGQFVSRTVVGATVVSVGCDVLSEKSTIEGAFGVLVARDAANAKCLHLIPTWSGRGRRRLRGCCSCERCNRGRGGRGLGSLFGHCVHTI